MFKTCSCCHRELPPEYFWKDSGASDKLYHYCKECASAKNKRYKCNPATSRRNHLAKTFNLSEEDYNNLLEKQNGVCAICKEPNTIKGRGGKPLPLAIDHDHNTGKIRGLLCATCNIAIHKAEQDLSWFDTAKIYLQN